ncbi:MAG: cytochrome c [Flavobacteriaceae bacterium]|nr:cytochrome c [Flavobacteriaceae bacterium]
MMKRILILLIITGFFASCSGPERSPALVFMPDMYYSVPYEPYQKATFDYPNYSEQSEVSVFVNQANMSALKPVEGTVPQNKIGALPYNLPNTNEGYEAAKSIKSPLDSIDFGTKTKRAEKLYTQVCATCHGANGDGQGPIVQTGAYVGVPNFKDRPITEGTVYHVIMHGRNAMGSYAGHLNVQDRWLVAEYVMQLKNK